MVIESAQPISRPRQWAIRGALVLVLVIGNLLPVSLPDLLTPVLGPVAPQPSDPPTMHWQSFGFFEAQHGAFHIILSVALILVLLRRPLGNRLLVQFIALGLILHAINDVADLLEPTDPHPFGVVIVTLALLALVAAYPERLKLAKPPSFAAINRPLLLLTLVAALGLALQVSWAIRNEVGAAAFDPYQPGWLHHGIALSLLLVLGGVLAASQAPGWRPLTAALGTAFLYLGASSVASPTALGTWGLAGGAAAIVAGILYLGLLARDARRRPSDLRQAPA